MQTDRKIISQLKLKKIIDKKRERLKVVFVSGSFDIIHTGHLLFLDYAKRQGDILIVSVGSDQMLRYSKGPTRPFIPEKLRLRMIAGLEIVDYVTLVDEDYSDGIGLKQILSNIRPHIWVFSFESQSRIERINLAKNLGIKIMMNPRIKPNKIKFSLSTTYIENKIKKEGS